MAVELRDYEKAIQDTRNTDPALSSELHNRCGEVLRVQENIIYWLGKTERLEDYTGKFHAKVAIALKPIPAGGPAQSPEDNRLGDETVPADPEVEEEVDDMEDILNKMARLG